MRFHLPGSRDEAEFTMTGGASAGSMVARWVSPGEGREQLNAMLGELFILEVDHLATAVAAGDTYRVAPLKELAEREGWTLESRVKEEPDTYRLQRDGAATASTGPRLDLLLILELLLRGALLPFEGRPDAPSWVGRAREAHPKLVAALQGHDLLQPKEDSNA